jgi:RNA-directed DNA polymerase
MPSPSLVSVLARCFLAGEPAVEYIVARAGKMLGRPWPWLEPVAQRYIATMAGRTRPRHHEVVQYLLHDPDLKRAWSEHFHELSVEHWPAEPQRMQPVAAARTWGVPVIESVPDLADWFWLKQGELEWLADLKGLRYKKASPLLRHYHYRVLAKRSGNIRLIEAPKPRLKEMQRQVLAQILSKIPPHPAVHGFIKRRSIKTFVASHVGRRVVLRMDMRDFFPSFAAARIQTVFRLIGYPEPVADLLGGICTNAVPRDVWNVPAFDIDLVQRWDARLLYSRPHLPQGAPTSPALANICAYRLDCRLDGLARCVGAEYTRYADDLAFSGGEAFERRVERFSTHVAAILSEEGFTVHHRKTRIMRQGVRQHLAGLVTNQHVNVERADFDRLKATLTNCVRLGPESQNRDAHLSFRSHLDGRVGFVEMINPAKGKRLRAIFDDIDWP